MLDFIIFHHAYCMQERVIFINGQHIVAHGFLNRHFTPPTVDSTTIASKHTIHSNTPGIDPDQVNIWGQSKNSPRRRLTRLSGASDAPARRTA
jgi:hypothetical protein